MRHAGALLLVLGAGCANDAALPQLGGAPDLAPACSRRHAFDGLPQSIRGKADVLFLVDDSNGTAPIQQRLQAAFGRFLSALEAQAALAASAGRAASIDLNIGVVTSDLGAGQTGAPGCTPSQPPGGGNQGRLQGIGRRAAPSCQKPRETNFLHVVLGRDGVVSSNLPDGQDAIATFACMTAVGDSGCGFEMPLEAAYAALRGSQPDASGAATLPDNLGSASHPGFLRDDAVLLVAFVTDEDDASAPPEADLFDKNKVPEYGYEDSYSRQTRYGVVCGDPPMAPPRSAGSDGPLAGCRPAPNPEGRGPGRLLDVGRYVDYFTRPAVSGGVKPNPYDVILVAIDGPEQPFEVLLANPGTPASEPYVACPRYDEASSPACVPVLQHSCRDGRGASKGDPAVRLNEVVRAAPQHLITSVCDDDYAPALEQAAGLLSANFAFDCVPDALPVNARTGALDLTSCRVQDETVAGDGSCAASGIPRCDEGGARPCWDIQPTPDCASASPDGVRLVVRRAVPPPAHTYVAIACG